MCSTADNSCFFVNQKSLLGQHEGTAKAELSKSKKLVTNLLEIENVTRAGTNPSPFYGPPMLLTSHTYSASTTTMNFASAKPRLFKESLINFNDINLWFTIPNNIANSSILQILSQQYSSNTPLVRLTVIAQVVQ